MDSLTARTRGIAGLDVSTVTSCTLWDTRVCRIPLKVKGPIGKGGSALLLGRSSTTLTGLSILPEVIDVDYEGVIQAMAWTPSPPMLIPKGATVAQLIRFKAIVPQVEICDRHDAEFGSTGPLSAFWASAITIKRPTLTLTLHHPPADPSSAQITVLMDTGADVTVISLHDWPKSWPLDSTTKGLVGVGGVSGTFQSRYMLSINTHEGSLYNVRLYAALIPVSLLGRDVMGQGEFTLSFLENFQ